MWWIFFATAWLTALLFVPVKNWKRLLVSGVIGMLIILFVDSSLIALGAFQFRYEGLKVLGLPLPYWISYLPGGILFAHYRPSARSRRLPYIIIASGLFVIIEFTTIRLGLFEYLNWSLLKAFILDIGGFTILLWLTEWFNTVFSFK